MNNVFNLIKNSILHNYTPTYGDLINENKQEVFNHAVHNICSDDEYNEYMSIANSDKQRLLKKSDASILTNFYKKTINQSQTHISGIGDVTQIC